MVAMPSCSKERQAKMVLKGQPWFYPSLVAYSYFWFCEGAERVMCDSAPKHTWPVHDRGNRSNDR